MLEGLSAFGVGATTKLLDNAIQYYTNKNLAAQQQSNTQKNMNLQQQLEDESWYNRIAKSTSALKAAGLSPVLATGAVHGSAAISHSEGLPQVSPSYERINDYMLQSSQVKLNEAAAEKAHAEAVEAESRTPNYEKTGREIESRTRLNTEQVQQVQAAVHNLDQDTLFTKQEYMRKLDEDKVSAALVKDEFKARVDGATTQYERDFWNALYELADSDEMTIGALMALRSWTAYNDQVDEWQKESLARQLQSHLLRLQLDDNDIIYSLAHMPVQNFLKVQAEVGDLVESSKFRKASRDYGIPAQAAFLNQQAKTMKNNDFVGHINNGEYGQAALTQVPQLLRLTEDAALLYFLKGRGAAAASSSHTLSDVAKPISSKVAKALSDKAHNWAKTRQGQLNSSHK